MSEFRYYVAGLLALTVGLLLISSENVIGGILIIFSALSYISISYAIKHKKEATDKIKEIFINELPEVTQKLHTENYTSITKYYKIRTPDEVNMFTKLITYIGLQNAIVNNIVPSLFSTITTKKQFKNIAYSFFNKIIFYYNPNISYYKNKDIHNGELLITEGIMVFIPHSEEIKKQVQEFVLTSILGLFSGNNGKITDGIDLIAGKDKSISVDLRDVFKKYMKNKTSVLIKVPDIVSISFIKHEDIINSLVISNGKKGIDIIPEMDDLLLSVLLSCIYNNNTKIDYQKTVNRFT